MELLFLVSVGIILLRAVYANWMLGITAVWLLRSSKTAAPLRKDQTKKFIIIIPVLREKKILMKTVNYFLSLDYDPEQLTIIIVSTERENAEANSKLRQKTTIDLTEQLRDAVNERYGKEIIVHLHYPRSDGKMVHQINYSFAYIFKKGGYDLKNTFVALYNADSRPDPETFSIVASLAGDQKRRVFQQSALFFDNFKRLKSTKNFFERGYLIANATLHSRWTLAHELPRLLRQSSCIRTFKKRFFLSHCVGHGLFLRLDFLKKIKSFPEHTLTEDLFFGYIVSALGEAIYPLPVMEQAEAPASFLSACKQKYVWFFGPMDHFSYERYFKIKFPGCASSLALKWLTLQGLLPALAWLIMGWLFIYIFIYPLALHSYQLLAASILLFCFYGPASYAITLRVHTRLHPELPITYSDYFRTMIFSFPAILFHSLPPLVSLAAKIKQLLTQAEPLKPKTER